MQFYTYSFDSLLKYEPLAEAHLDKIEERLVQKYTVWALARECERDKERTTSVATVNRWRATLRKALRMARRWKLIQSVPEIPRLKGARERSFVFTEALRRKYNEVAPEPLNTFVQLSCEIGICEGEMIDLLKGDVHLRGKADEWGHYGYVQIRNGKTEFRKRSLPVTARAKQILTTWMTKSKADRVFTSEDGVSPVSAYTLIQQQERMRQLLNLPWDACVHSARHTALTNLGLTGVDAFTLQRAAGHANISTTRKYVHTDATGDVGRVPEEGAKRATRPPCGPSQAVGSHAGACCRSCADTGFQFGWHGAVRYSGLRDPAEKTSGIFRDPRLLSVTFGY